MYITDICLRINKHRFAACFISPTACPFEPEDVRCIHNGSSSILIDQGKTMFSSIINRDLNLSHSL